MTDERYQKIMADLGLPNSRSLLQALKQEQATLRRMTYKDDKITARLEAIHRLLEKANGRG